jgi:hypothetical protein
VPTSARGERRERTIYRENEDYPIGSEQRERSKYVVYIERTGNLIDRDEEEKKRSERSELQAVVIVAEPRQRYQTRR